MGNDFELLTLKDRTKWEGLVELSVYRDIHQLPVYLEPFEEHMCAKAYLARYMGRNCEIMFPFFLRDIPISGNEDEQVGFKDMVSPWYYGGPFYIGQVDDTAMRTFKDILVEFCRENSVVTIFSRFNPYLGNHNKTIGNLNIRKINTVVWMDLTNSIDDIWNRSLSKECRRKIRVSESKGVTNRMSDNIADLEKFYHLYIEDMKRKGADKFYMFSWDFLKKLFESLKGDMVISCLEHKGNLLASSVWVQKFNVMYSYLGTRNSDFPHINSSSLEIWYTIKAAKEYGNRVMDLGGGMLVNPGLLQYKRIFSNNTLSLYGQNTVIDFERYKQVCSCYGLNVQNLLYENSRFFPEYRYDLYENDQASASNNNKGS